MTAPLFSTPQEAEAAFYDAFMRADFDTMMSVWADDPAITCIHPGSVRLQGVRAVAASWREIFANGPALSFELEDVHCTRGPLLSLHSVFEVIRVNGVKRGIMQATNVYRLTQQGWRMVLHHASPMPQPGEQPPANALH